MPFDWTQVDLTDCVGLLAVWLVSTMTGWHDQWWRAPAGWRLCLLVTPFYFVWIRHSNDECAHLVSLRWVEFSHFEPCYNKSNNLMVTPSDKAVGVEKSPNNLSPPPTSNICYSSESFTSGRERSMWLGSPNEEESSPSKNFGSPLRALRRSKFWTIFFTTDWTKSSRSF